MSNYEDVMVLVGAEDAADEMQEAMAVQRVINRGMWGLEGSAGRRMMEFIEAGLCMLGRERARDYYGNTIPSREDVVEGTKGSRQYVAAANGEEWAAAMEGV